MEVDCGIYSPESMAAKWTIYIPIYSEDAVNGPTYWRRSVEYRVMANTGLALVDSVRINGNNFHEGKNSYVLTEYSLELYRGNTDDYLVIARSDNTIYCMQYINSADSNEYYEGGILNESVYAHYYRGTEALSGGYYDYAAYFLDGTCVDLTFTYGIDRLYYKEHRTGKDMLITYFDICTYDDDFTDDFTMASK